MALPASGAISTGDLETEFAGFTPATKTLENYAAACGSGGTDTALFNSKICPITSAVYFNNFTNPVINLTAFITGTTGCRARLELSSSPTFAENTSY